MNWQAVSAIGTVVVIAASGLNWVMMLRISLEIERLKAHISESRMQDREEMRKWINGSFLRSAVVTEKFESISGRLTDLQANGCARRSGCAE